MGSHISIENDTPLQYFCKITADSTAVVLGILTATALISLASGVFASTIAELEFDASVATSNLAAKITATSIFSSGVTAALWAGFDRPTERDRLSAMDSSNHVSSAYLLASVIENLLIRKAYTRISIHESRTYNRTSFSLLRKAECASVIVVNGSFLVLEQFASPLRHLNQNGKREHTIKISALRASDHYLMTNIPIRQPTSLIAPGISTNGTGHI